MTRLSIQITLAIAASILPLGCTGLSHFREDIALREMAKHSYASKSNPRGTGDHARHYERGWRQAYFNVSRGADTCPPSVPPEVYWSTKYQTPRGCQQIAAWYEGYRCGAAAAEAECRPAYSKVPVMANCIRPDSQECNPVESLRSDAVGMYGGVELPVETHFAQLDDDKFGDDELGSTELGTGKERDALDQVEEQFTVSRFDDATPSVESVTSTELNLDVDDSGDVTPTSFSQSTRLPAID